MGDDEWTDSAFHRQTSRNGGPLRVLPNAPGMSLALAHAGFEEIEFSRLQDNFTNQLIVTARKPVHMGEGIPISAQVKPALL